MMTILHAAAGPPIAATPALPVKLAMLAKPTAKAWDRIRETIGIPFNLSILLLMPISALTATHSTSWSQKGQQVVLKTNSAWADSMTMVTITAPVCDAACFLLIILQQLSLPQPPSQLPPPSLLPFPRMPVKIPGERWIGCQFSLPPVILERSNRPEHH